MALTTQQRTAWWLFAPPALLTGLRWLLQWQEGRGPASTVLPLSPFAGAQPLSAMLWQVAGPLLALLVLALGLWWVRRRWGWPTVQRILLGLWVAVCLGGGAALLWRPYNLQGLQALPPVQAQVLGHHTKMPNLRSTGGTELVLRVATLEPLQQILIDDPQAAQWQPGQTLQLQWARGRHSGLFVTGWQALPSAAPTASTPEAFLP
ncbi:hypothetical protein [Giesbergeria anulus]|uniref:Uncharacterized protein n=1 Tax=Giesbergeria anulus TaxID=180197 RepID=A0A1H9QSR4_9BURK|nr:hypothetical protein [Giesbergeria anulus]SER62743.1 hypothetical protein SAMN02982919_02721 [Giesbergeria anulus]